jgi:hypothetical protein
MEPLHQKSDFVENIPSTLEDGALYSSCKCQTAIRFCRSRRSNGQHPRKATFSVVVPRGTTFSVMQQICHILALRRFPMKRTAGQFSRLAIDFFIHPVETEAGSSQSARARCHCAEYSVHPLRRLVIL